VGKKRRRRFQDTKKGTGKEGFAEKKNGKRVAKKAVKQKAGGRLERGEKNLKKKKDVVSNRKRRGHSREAYNKKRRCISRSTEKKRVGSHDCAFGGGCSGREGGLKRGGTRILYESGGRKKRGLEPGRLEKEGLVQEKIRKRGTASRLGRTKKKGGGEKKKSSCSEKKDGMPVCKKKGPPKKKIVRRGPEKGGKVFFGEGEARKRPGKKKRSCPSAPKKKGGVRGTVEEKKTVGEKERKRCWFSPPPLRWRGWKGLERGKKTTRRGEKKGRGKKSLRPKTANKRKRENEARGKMGGEISYQTKGKKWQKKGFRRKGRRGGPT